MLHSIGTEVQVIAPCPAYGMYGVVVGYGDGAEYQVDMNAIERNCFDHAECIAGWNGISLRRVGGDDGPDDALPPLADPGATIPLTGEIGLAA